MTDVVMMFPTCIWWWYFFYCPEKEKNAQNIQFMNLDKDFLGLE